MLKHTSVSIIFLTFLNSQTTHAPPNTPPFRPPSHQIVLTSYHFPSFAFLAACQFLFTTVVIFCLNFVGRVQVTAMSWEVLRVMAPLVIISLINVLSGLGGTQKISLPMFTALRRFSILMTMLLEAYVFGTSPSAAVKMSVFLMIFGALVAALSDLTFDTVGYSMIFLSDLFTALNGVVMKRTLTACPAVNKMAVLYYNSLFG
jgi:solute carrier family 35 protein